MASDSILRTSAVSMRRRAIPHSRSTTSPTTVLPKRQLVPTLSYSLDFKIMLLILYDPHPRESFKEHERDHSPSSKNTNIYLRSFQRDRILSAVKTFSCAPSIVTRFSGDNGLELFEARMTVLRKEPSFPQPQTQGSNSVTAVAFNVSLSRAGVLEVATLTTSVGVSILFPDKMSFFGTTNVRSSHGFQPIQVYMDTEPCLISNKTQHRTTQSMHLAAAHCRARSTLHVAPESEVLLVNQYGEIMDGTSFTP